MGVIKTNPTNRDYTQTAEVWRGKEFVDDKEIDVRILRSRIDHGSHYEEKLQIEYLDEDWIPHEDPLGILHAAMCDMLDKLDRMSQKP